MRGADVTSVERVKSALLHAEPDRIPLDIGGSRVTGVHIQAYKRYRRALGLPASATRMQILYLQLPKVEEDFRALLGVDMENADPVTRPFESGIARDGTGYSYTDMWGCEYFMPEAGAYFDLRRHPLAGAESTDDVENYSWPKGDARELLESIEAEAAGAWTERKRALVLGRTCPGIFEMCQILCGHEKAFCDYALNPALPEAIMDHVLEHKLEFYRAAIDILLKSGLEYFIISESDDLGAQGGLLISPDMYRRLVKPRHAQLFQSIKEFSQGRAFVELHSCGAIKPLIPDLIQAGVEILNPVQVSAQGMDTKSLKREFGKDIVFHGGGVDSQRTLPYGTPDEVREEVRHRIEDLAPGGGFIFTPVHSIQHDVPFENFMAMLEAFREYS